MIYFVQDTVSQAIKIGSSVAPLKRLATLQTSHINKLVLLGTMDGSEKEEQALHAMFVRLVREWFEPTEDLLSYIHDHTTPPLIRTRRLVQPPVKLSSSSSAPPPQTKTTFTMVRPWKDHAQIGADELSMSEAADLLDLERTRAFRVIKLYGVAYRYVTPKLIAIDRASLEQLIASGRPKRGQRGKDRQPRRH